VGWHPWPCSLCRAGGMRAQAVQPAASNAGLACCCHGHPAGRGRWRELHPRPQAAGESVCGGTGLECYLVVVGVHLPACICAREALCTCGRAAACGGLQHSLKARCGTRGAPGLQQRERGAAAHLRAPRSGSGCARCPSRTCRGGRPARRAVQPLCCGRLPAERAAQIPPRILRAGASRASRAPAVAMKPLYCTRAGCAVAAGCQLEAAPARHAPDSAPRFTRHRVRFTGRRGAFFAEAHGIIVRCVPRLRSPTVHLYASVKSCGYR
jgi:hypothetical protein